MSLLFIENCIFEGEMGNMKFITEKLGMLISDISSPQIPAPIKTE